MYVFLSERNPVFAGSFPRKKKSFFLQEKTSFNEHKTYSVFGGDFAEENNRLMAQKC